MPSEALNGSVRLENGADKAGICPGLSIAIQIIHLSLLLRTKKLLQHNAFLRARSVRSRENGHALKKAKTLHEFYQSLPCEKDEGIIGKG